MSEALSTYDESTLAAIVAGNVRARAARLGFNQSLLAARLGTAQSVISKKWRGERAWKLEDLDQLGEVLQCAPWDLTRPEYDESAQPKLSAVRDSGRPTGIRTQNQRIIGLGEDWPRPELRLVG